MATKKKAARGKSKKLDPDMQKKQFEDWKLTDEYIKWVKLSDKKNDIKKDYPSAVTDQEDLTGDWQEFEDKLFDFFKTFKVKTKLKELKHEFVRSFFFAKEEKNNVYIDGVKCAVLKEYADNARFIRIKFTEIWTALDEIHDLDHTTYLTVKKKMVKDMGEFLKTIVPHMKQPHKEIYEERLATVLRPFSNLLKTNMRYSAFEAMYDSPESREILEFKHKTLLDEFCKDFQECLRILHEVEGNIDKQIVANPNVRRIFNKLSIEKWQENKIQFFYLSKLRSTFFTMRNHLIKLFVKGIDYWKIPLSNNQQFLEDVRKLIDCELICERLLGDDLKRDQLNFVFDNLAIVLESKGKEKMLKKEELITKISVPKLLVFKTLQKMRSILDLKKKDQTKDHIEKKQGGAFFQFSVIPIQEDPNENEEILASALKSPFLKTSQKSPGKKEDEEEEEKLKKIEEVERKKYGRYFIWEDYVDETNKNLFLNTVEELRHINIAVQQDIQDKIITEGLNAPTSYLEHRDLYMEEVKKTREFLSNLYAEDNKKDAINNIRPPIVWNHPKVWEDNHQYRSIANPQECYKDNRIQSILQTIEILGKHLSTYKKDHFEELINRVIDCFNSEYNAKLNPLSIY